MKKIIECVPNISEGRDKEKINTIAKAAAAVPGVMLLDVDPGASTNRTVITLAGEPEAVPHAAVVPAHSLTAFAAATFGMKALAQGPG